MGGLSKVGEWTTGGLKNLGLDDNEMEFWSFVGDPLDIWGGQREAAKIKQARIAKENDKALLDSLEAPTTGGLKL